MTPEELVKEAMRAFETDTVVLTGFNQPEASIYVRGKLLTTGKRWKVLSLAEVQDHVACSRGPTGKWTCTRWDAERGVFNEDTQRGF